MSRIQCTPDLQPTDITGLSVWNPNTREFEFRPGPIFANVLVVDEVNRALPKAQSALLEGMAEHQVTVDGVTHPLPDPFLVIATENTIEQEGTFPLPEAQLDRFLVRTSLGYPSLDEELADRRRAAARASARRPAPGRRRRRARRRLRRGRGDLHRPAAEAVGASSSSAARERRVVEIGASVRGSLALERMARARALVEGRDYVVAEDIERLFAPVVGHRLILSADALIGSDASDERRCSTAILAACLERVPRPEPDWEAGATPEGHEPGGASARSPSSRAGGSSAFASASIEARGAGQGDEVAGTRPYRPGDRRTWIDWAASARLSAARGTRRVRRPRVLRRHRAAGRARRRPAAADGALRAAAARGSTRPAATEAAVRVDRPARPRRPAASSPTSTSARSRPRWLSPGPPLTRARARRRGQRRRLSGRRAPALDGSLARARPACLELPRRNVRFRRLRLHRRRLPTALAQAARAPLGRHARRRPGPDVGAVVPGRRRRPPARPRPDDGRRRRDRDQRTRGARTGGGERAPARSGCSTASRGSGSTRSCSEAASRRRSPTRFERWASGGGACGGGAREARCSWRSCGARAWRSPTGGAGGGADDHRDGRSGEPALRRPVRRTSSRRRSTGARRQRADRRRRRALHARRARRSIARSVVGRRRPHHRDRDDRLPRRPPAWPASAALPSPCRRPASSPAARSPSRRASRSRVGLARRRRGRQGGRAGVPPAGRASRGRRSGVSPVARGGARSRCSASASSSPVARSC